MFDKDGRQVVFTIGVGETEMADLCSAYLLKSWTAKLSVWGNFYANQPHCYIKVGHNSERPSVKLIFANGQIRGGVNNGKNEAESRKTKAMLH